MSEHETWYRASRNGHISAAKVTKHTDTCVWVEEGFLGICRRRRLGFEWGIFPTWVEARRYIEAAAREELELSRRQLDTARSRLATIQAMKEPDNE